MKQLDSDKFVLDQRRDLRNRAIRAREALSAESHSALVRQVEAHLVTLLARLGPITLGFCWPIRGEPDLLGLVARWLEADPARRAALPVLLDKEKMLTFREWRPGTEMVPDRHGIPHPSGGAALQPDAIFVPLNAFDANGYRLGYGGGYFDRTLAQMRTCAIGVGFESGRAETVFPQAHDLPMDWIVTEEGIFVPRDQPRNRR